MHSNVAVEPDQHLLPAFARCGICGKRWDDDDDETTMVVVQEQGEEVPLTEFVGLPLHHARNTFMQRGRHGGVLHELSPYVLHRNDPAYEDPVDWSYVIQPGDIGLALLTSYGHPECHEDVPQE